MSAPGLHYFSLTVPREAGQLEWRENLLRAGLRFSPVIERLYHETCLKPLRLPARV